MPFETKYDKKIPVIFAGGVFDGEDIAEMISYGADAVQMATRFVATEECDAHMNFKMAFINATKEDAKIIVSPVGMPGRAVQNDFLENVAQNNAPKIKKCVNCLSTCDPKTTPYCISQALIASVGGDITSGLIFAGENVYKVNEMSTVEAIFKEVQEEAERFLSINCLKDETH